MIWIEVIALPSQLNGFCVLPGGGHPPGRCRSKIDVERFYLDRATHFVYPYRQLAGCREVGLAVTKVSNRAVRIEFYGPLEFTFRFGPVPVIRSESVCERGVSFGQIRVDLKGTGCRCFRQRKSFLR